MADQWTTEAVVSEVTTEDGGMVKTAEINDDASTGMYVRLISYGDHHDFDDLIRLGHYRYRVRVERLEG